MLLGPGLSARDELWEQTWEAGGATSPEGKRQGRQSNTQHEGEGPGEGARREGNHTKREMQQRVNWLDSQGQQV